MKTTLVIQDNKQQVVFTPENEHEKSILKLIESQEVEVALKVGNFSECQGGWVRYYPMSIPMYGVNDNEFDSLMLVLKPKESKAD